MARLGVISVVLMGACTGREPSDRPATPAEPVSVVRGESPAATTWLWRADGPELSDPGYLLGVIGQAGIEHCPGGGFDRQWLRVRPTIGRVSVSGPDESEFDSLMGQPVLAVGRPRPAPSVAMTEPVELCPPPQMRSDWRQTPLGVVIEREPAPRVEHFELTAMRALHELSARLEGDSVVVTLLNPMPIALRGVELRVHYEGCFGKPGTVFEAIEIGDLGVGADASAQVPKVVTRGDARPGRSLFRAFSVQLVATGDGLVLDLDVLLQRLGAEVECSAG